VVIVTYNSAAVVGALLDSLPQALGDLGSEVVVVDNGSTDDTVATLRRRGTHVVEATNDGYAAGINRGVAALSPGLPVLVLNPDVVLAPGSVQPLLDRLDDPGVGIVAPRMLDGDGALTPSLRRRPTLLRSLGLGFTGLPGLSEDITAEEVYGRSAVVAWATGAVLLVRRECHEALGGWDASYFLYSEETDFSLRARDHGWVTVYEPSSTAWHTGSHSGWNDKLYAMQILNRVRLYGRRHGGPAAWAFYGVALVREAELAVRGHHQSRRALRALLSPGARPQELGLSAKLAPW
jgi:GT2 family glycosyltransferase